MTAIMENREWVYQNGVLVEQEADVKATINNTYKVGISKDKLNELFTSIVSMIGVKS